MSHWKSQLHNYHGSKTLMPLAHTLGIQVDKLNFLAAGFTTVGLAYLYSVLMHLGHLSARTAKILLIIIGFIVLYFCFGRDLIFVVMEAGVGYALTRVTPVEQLPQVTMVFSLGYQSMLHLWRQFADPGGYTIDVTGGLMMLTQRITAVAFSIRDGIGDNENTKELTPSQKNEAIKELPDALSYFAYMFDFHLLLAGPLVPYNVCNRVAHGQNVRADGSFPVDHRKIFEELVCVISSIVLLLGISPIITEAVLFSESYSQQAFSYKVAYLVTFCFVCRLQYYIAWKLAEATCQASSYGFYVDKDGKEHFDGADNIRILQVEFATSFKSLIDNWNMSTQRWLKHVCYDRDIEYKTARTFFLSALWHGLYPGYFLSFTSNMYFVMAGRQMRHYVRPRVLASGFCPKVVYDVITWMFTIVFLSYSVIPFILLHSDKAFHIWRELYFFGHIVGGMTFALQLFLTRRPNHDSRGAAKASNEVVKSKLSRKSIATTTSDKSS